jgi:hypothetical protein
MATPGRPPKPVKVVPADLCDATVRKRREKGRVVEMVRTVVLGTLFLLAAPLSRSTANTTINTSLVERINGTDRHQNARKRRKTCKFSKDLAGGSWQARSPAMAARLSDQVWTIEEWISYPANCVSHLQTPPLFPCSLLSPGIQRHRINAVR